MYNVVRIQTRDFLPILDYIDTWDVDKILKRPDIKRIRYFWFEEREKVITDHPFTATTKTIRTSPIYYVNAYIETIDDVKVKNKELYNRMKRLGWNKIVCSIYDSWCYKFCKRDVILDVYN